ncbi:hypothetical protein ABFS83_13G160200 [Erythranthe nasuta]
MGNEVHHLHKSIWETWILWTLLVFGFLILFLLVFYFRNPNSAKRSKHQTNLENLSDQSPTIDEVKIMIKTEEEMRKPSSSSELVFFVEEEERFTLDELLEGPADMRTHGFCSSLYTVQLKNNVVLAVKRLKMLNGSSLDEFCRTMNVVGELKHPNILPLLCYRSTPDEKLLVYRYQTNGSLLNLFESKNSSFIYTITYYFYVILIIITIFFFACRICRRKKGISVEASAIDRTRYSKRSRFHI